MYHLAFLLQEFGLKVSPTAIELVYFIEVYELDSAGNISSLDLIKFGLSFWYVLDIECQNL